jgi:CheY-like chemotaxis protein
VLDAASDFAAAKEILCTGPDLLITDLKLGAYNGLHLAIRSKAQGTPAIVIGEPDPVQETEARRQGARYLPTPIDLDRLLGCVAELLNAAQHTRRSPRKHVPMVDVLVNDVRGHLLDVSYEGLRLEAVGSADTIPAFFKVKLPLFDFSCDVQRVWAAGSGPAVSCGAALSPRDADTLVAWRTVVDALPGLAVTA